MSDRQRIGGIDIVDGTPTPVCRWCHETKGQHLPPSQPNRMRARMPCLGWQEHFSPEASAPAPSDATPPSMGDAPGETRPSLGELLAPRLQLNDHLRLKAAREIWALHIERHDAHMSDTLYEYERLAKERLGK